MQAGLLFLLLCLASMTSAAATCLHYEGEPVTLTGKIGLQTFYGPPNYGENPATDSRETQAILRLATPICVDEIPSHGYEAEASQSKITLVPPNDVKLKSYVGKHVTLQGTLFHAHTGHHHTPVLMQIRRIEEARD